MTTQIEAPNRTRVGLSPAVARTGVVAVLRADSARFLLPAVSTLADSGLVCLELTLTTPGALKLLPALREAFPHADIGMGSVRSAAAARRCLDAGAQFLVSAGFNAGVVAEGVADGVPVYPGGLTPTEIATAWDAGAAAVKLFPAASMGPAHLKAIRDPYPDILIMPTGGIGIEDVAMWIKAGAIAVGLGSSLSGDSLRGGDLSALADRARRALAGAATARP